MLSLEIPAIKPNPHLTDEVRQLIPTNLPNEALSPLHKLLLVPCFVTNLNDVTLHFVVEYLDRLRKRHTARKKLDQIARLEQDVWVPCFTGSMYCHRAFDEIEFTPNANISEGPGDHRPNLAQVFLTVLREESCERALL